MNILFLLTTSFTVSIDSFLCGFSLSMRTEKKPLIVLGICFTVFVLCLITNYLGLFLQNVLTERVANFGGIILIAVGLYNIFGKQKTTSDKGGMLKQCLLIGFAVGLDGSAANLSLSLMGYNAFYVPVTITLMHFATITLGILLSKTRIACKLKKFDFIAPLILIALGIYKVVCAFV